MRTTLGIAALGVSAVLAVVVALALRTRVGPRTTYALLALAGAGLGLGGLLVQDGVSGASWIAAPAFLAMVAPLHVRLLFAEGGPFRT